MSDEPSLQQAIIAGVEILRVIHYGMLCSSVLLWFDIILTFPAEYDRIWKRKFTGASMVYLFKRYGTALEMLFNVLQMPAWGVNQHLYVRTYHICRVCFRLYLKYRLRSLRVFAIWGKDWRPLVVVAPLSMIKPVIVAVRAFNNKTYILAVASLTLARAVSVLYDRSFAQTDYPYLRTQFTASVSYPTHVSHRTFQARSSPLLLKLIDMEFRSASIVAIVTTAAAEMVLLVVTLVRTIGVKRHSLGTGMKTPLTDILLRNGSVHFLILSLGLIVEGLSHKYMDARVPTSALAFWLITPYLNESFNAMILSRFILALRSDHFASGSSERASSQATPSLLNFRGFSSSVLGNLGATLNVTPAPLEPPGPEDHFHYSEYENDRFCEDPFAVGFNTPSTSARRVPDEGVRAYL
ncbi:hypothetical protein PYCCODRAFT_1471754 [Trametes coccinea BRFM310]|uniref:DUF6533 domain-containing protein n=1 Tax=Trametes coccinea (strain BRFM310) TaxID=1353009 RepID=A0A1Y2IAW2_TRAC3|nr:hypothetical protein PYCCODRAFT_1471754 [Trametes coccinea BRFM310]